MPYTDIFGGTTLYASDVSFLAVTLTANIELEWPLESNAPTYPAARIIKVTTSGGAYDITLPDATLTGPGQTILFDNASGSSHSFDILDNAGGAVATVAVGEQWQVYLSAVATAAGTWDDYRFGASTASVQASALAGYGLTAISNPLSQAMSVTPFSVSPRTILPNIRPSANPR